MSLFVALSRTAGSIKRKLTKALRRDGYLGTINLVLRNCWYLLRSPFPNSRRNTSNAFDIEWGVDTCRLVEQGDLDVHGIHQIYAGRYEPTPAPAFREMIAALDGRYEEFTFVDIGSGKGRILLLAAEYPFRAIIGVELSPMLHQIAVHNIEKCRVRFRACENVTSTCVDAAEYRLPPGPLILYFYYPFDLPVMEKVVANIRNSLVHEPREIQVIYYNPVYSATLEKDALFVPLRRGEGFIIYSNTVVSELQVEPRIPEQLERVLRAGEVPGSERCGTGDQ